MEALFREAWLSWKVIGQNRSTGPGETGFAKHVTGKVAVVGGGQASSEQSSLGWREEEQSLDLPSFSMA